MREHGWVITSTFYFINLFLYASKEHPIMLVVQVLICAIKVMWIVPLVLRRLKG